VCTQRGTEAIVVRFDAATCRACPAKPRCTTATRTGRRLSLRPRQVHEAVEAARAEQSSDQWRHDDTIRAGVEGAVRQATHSYLAGAEAGLYEPSHAHFERRIGRDEPFADIEPCRRSDPFSFPRNLVKLRETAFLGSYLPTTAGRVLDVGCAREPRSVP
jgi:hypothetical protein